MQSSGYDLLPEIKQRIADETVYKCFDTLKFIHKCYDEIMVTFAWPKASPHP